MMQRLQSGPSTSHCQLRTPSLRRYWAGSAPQHAARAYWAVCRQEVVLRRRRNRVWARQPSGSATERACRRCLSPRRSAFSGVRAAGQLARRPQLTVFAGACWSVRRYPAPVGGLAFAPPARAQPPYKAGSGPIQLAAIARPGGGCPSMRGRAAFVSLHPSLARSVASPERCKYTRGPSSHTSAYTHVRGTRRTANGPPGCDHGIPRARHPLGPPDAPPRARFHAAQLVVCGRRRPWRRRRRPF